MTLKIPRGTIFHVLFLLALLFCAIFFSASKNPIRVKMQNLVFDEFNKRHMRERGNGVVIVDIDEKSLAELGQWPWPRYILADLTRRLTEKGAKAIAFDGVFAEADQTSMNYLIARMPKKTAEKLSKSIKKDEQDYDYDKNFSKAIEDSGVFVSAFTHGREDRKTTDPVNKNRILMRSDVKSVFIANASPFNAAAVNLPDIANAAAGNGSFMAQPDSDGVLRRSAMVFTNGKALYPALSIEAVRVSKLGRKGTITLAEVPEKERGVIDTNYRIVMDNLTVPIENDGILYVYYRNFCNEQDVERGKVGCTVSDYISAYKFLGEEFDEETTRAVKNKIVLIGASAEGLKDLRNTSLESFRPGVEVHANVIEQILNNDFLLRPDLIIGVEALFILGVGLLFIMLAPFVGVIISMLLCVTIIGLAGVGAYISYAQYGLLVDPVYPSLAVLSIFIASTMLSYARAETRRKEIRNAFGMYVASDVMRDLERHPEKLKLGGESRELTVMFTDIRKFTAISEGLSPEELIQLMNEFLTSMTDIVMSHQGTVDKYIGDAMMSFWNAPRDVEDHARQACLAALEMQSALEPINEKVKERAIKIGKDPVLLKVGIGVNTGLCAVGNMGSKQRFAYSALGDAVNLSSRLEGQTKAYGTPIIVGQDTQAQAQDLAMLELDTIKVVGKEQTVRIYALMGDEKLAQSNRFQTWAAHQKLMLKAYRYKDFTSALGELTRCMIHADENMKHYYKMFEKRIEKLEKENLPENWNGVFEAEKK